MNFKFLAESLHQTANAAQKYFQKYWAIPLAGFKPEEKIHKNVGMAPTLWAKTPDHHILCVDVAEVIYRPVLDEFVLDCKHNDLPVKLFVAVPKNVTDRDYGANRNKAQNRGVGILEIDTDGEANIVQQSLSLSLTNVRPIDPLDFPPAYRLAVSNSYEQFRQGHPVNACHEIAGQIESHTRTIAERLSKRGLWPAPVAINFKTHSWRSLLELLIKHCQSLQARHPNLTVDMLSQIVGIVPQRNQSGHVVKDTATLIRRDRELRTRFENMGDILREFTKATK